MRPRHLRSVSKVGQKKNREGVREESAHARGNRSLRDRCESGGRVGRGRCGYGQAGHADVTSKPAKPFNTSGRSGHEARAGKHEERCDEVQGMSGEEDDRQGAGLKEEGRAAEVARGHGPTAALFALPSMQDLTGRTAAGARTARSIEGEDGLPPEGRRHTSHTNALRNTSCSRNTDVQKGEPTNSDGGSLAVGSPSSRNWSSRKQLSHINSHSVGQGSPRMFPRALNSPTQPRSVISSSFLGHAVWPEYHVSVIHEVLRFLFRFDMDMV